MISTTVYYIYLIYSIYSMTERIYTVSSPIGNSARVTFIDCKIDSLASMAYYKLLGRENRILPQPVKE